MSEPWDVHSDIASGYGRARAMLGSWVSLKDQSLGAPFHANYQHGFPPEDLHVLITRILVNVTQNQFFAVNAQYLLGFGLSAVTFFWLCRKMRLPNSSSLILGISFTFLPFHFVRFEYGHLALADYFMVPIGIWVLVSEFLRITRTDQTNGYQNSTLTNSLLLSGLVGTAGAYFAFYFALFAISLSLLPWILSQRSYKSRAHLTMRNLLISVSFMASTIGHEVWTMLSRVPGDVSERYPAESLAFGGSLTRLLIPSGIWLPEKLQKIITREQFEWTATSATAAVGVCVAIVWVIQNISRVHVKRTVNPFRESVIYLMVIAISLYATSGLGYIFASVISPTFRAWNRMSLFISAFALLVVGIWIAEILKQRETWKNRSALTLFLILVLVTQLVPLRNMGIVHEPDGMTEMSINEIRTAARTLESETDIGCSFLQYPILRAFSADAKYELAGSDQYWLPFFLPKRRWSYGAPALTKEGEFWTDASKGGVTELYEVAKKLEFCGVVVYGDAFSDNEYWYRTTRSWERLAGNKAVRINTTLLYVPFTMKRATNNVAHSSEERSESWQAFRQNQP
jgi:phosphoglycerol transferase